MIEMTYSVPDISCDHCTRAITTELGHVSGVEVIDVDLAAKRVTVSGSDLDDAALRAAIEEAGYEAA